MSDAIEEYLYDKLDIARRKKHATGDELVVRECLYCGRHEKLYINVKKLIFNCYAASCSARGNIIALIQMVEGCDTHKASIVLTGLLGGIIKARPLSELADMFDRMERGSLNAVEDVGDLSVPLPEGFRPIYDDKAGTYCIPAFCRERNITKEMCREHGIGFTRVGRYRDRLVVPVHTAGASVWVARDMTGTAKAKYLNPGTLQAHFLWGYDHLLRGQRIYTMEGVFDAMRWHSYGLPSVAYFGSHLRGPQIQLLRKMEPSELVLVPDGEAYGEVIGRIGDLTPHFDVILAVRLDDGEDPDTVRRKRARQLARDARAIRGAVEALGLQADSMRDPWE